MAAEAARLFRLFIVGDGGAGKTTMVRRLQQGAFSGKEVVYEKMPAYQTVGARLPEYPTTHGKVTFTCYEFNDAKEAAAATITPDMIVLMFDVTSNSGFIRIPAYLQVLKKAFAKTPFMLCGAKVDGAVRSVSRGDAAEVAAFHEMPYFDYSSKSCYNWDKLFVHTIQTLVDPKAQLVWEDDDSEDE